MFALTLPKTIVATALAVAAFGTASVAQAGTSSPQGVVVHDGFAVVQGLDAPQKHPDLIRVLKRAHSEKHPDIFGVLKRAHAEKRPHVLIGLKKSPQIIAILCRKAGGAGGSY